MAAPVISSIAPNTGLPDTATAVTITGTGFTGATEVAFGETAATNLVVVSDTEITAETPLSDASTVGVTVFNPDGSDTLPAAFTFTDTIAVFPAFTPIVPPPLFGLGGGPPPTFPPPTPPPIGAIPSGVLVGPAVAPAPVPPSVAGFVQPQFGSGSATLPASSGLWPIFTSTFPSPTIVFSNIFTGAEPPITPPFTASTLNIVLGGWGPNVPPGAPTAPGSDGRLPRMLEILAAVSAMGGLHGGEVTGERRRARRR